MIPYITSHLYIHNHTYICIYIYILVYTAPKKEDAEKSETRMVLR